MGERRKKEQQRIKYYLMQGKRKTGESHDIAYKRKRRRHLNFVIIHKALRKRAYQSTMLNKLLNRICSRNEFNRYWVPPSVALCQTNELYKQIS